MIFIYQNIQAQNTKDTYTTKKIKPRNVAGIESYGMLCSGAELKVSDDDSGLYELDDETKIGCKF